MLFLFAASSVQQWRVWWSLWIVIAAVVVVTVASVAVACVVWRNKRNQRRRIVQTTQGRRHLWTVAQLQYNTKSEASSGHRTGLKPVIFLVQLKSVQLMFESQLDFSSSSVFKSSRANQMTWSKLFYFLHEDRQQSIPVMKRTHQAWN